MKKNKFAYPYAELVDIKNDILTVSINADPNDILNDILDDDYDWED